MDTNLAINWVNEKGTGLEKARLAYVLFGTEPDPEVVKPLITAQNKDGGFPFGMTMGNLSAIDQTLMDLGWLDELGMLESPTAEKSIHFLYASQKTDGGWDEEPELEQYPQPAWSKPGDMDSRLYLTANTAYWLAISGRTNRPNFHRALEFITGQQEKRGEGFGYLQTSWIAASVFLMAGPRYAEEARKSIQFFMDKPIARWECAQIAWALNYLSAAGLPENHPFAVRALAELVQRQSQDGSWASEVSPTYTMDATIRVLKALGYYDLL
jgi:squalene cyclase